MTDLVHAVRTKDGHTITIEKYTRGKAIRLFCTECMGWSGDPVKECTDTLCPLFTFRKRTLATYSSQKRKYSLSEEQKIKVRKTMELARQRRRQRRRQEE